MLFEGWVNVVDYVLCIGGLWDVGIEVDGLMEMFFIVVYGMFGGYVCCDVYC